MPPLRNILLVNPWIFDFTAYDFWMRPLGLLSVGAVIKRIPGVRVDMIDCLDRNTFSGSERRRGRPDGRGAYLRQEVRKPDILFHVPRRYSRYGILPEEFIRKLDRFPSPDAVLMTCTMTYWYPGVQMAVDLLRKKWGSVPIILGGIYATLLPDHARRFSGADVVVEGRGENRIGPLLAEILGLPSNLLQQYPSMDSLPFPAVELMRDRSAVALLTSRGCPFHCSYCAGPKLNPEFEQRSVERVMNEIESTYQHFGTRHFAFYDDALLMNRDDHILPLFRTLLKKKLPVYFHMPNGLHIREIDEKVAEIFFRAGVQSIYLSQESFSSSILRKSGGKVEKNDLKNALMLLEKAGFLRKRLNVYLLCGLPGQSITRLKEDILTVHHLGGRVRLSYFSPVPGTKEWDRLRKSGVIQKDFDPLISNKVAFPYLGGGISGSDFEELMRFVARLYPSSTANRL